MADSKNGGEMVGNALFTRNKWKVLVWFYCAYSNQSNLMRDSLSLCQWAERSYVPVLCSRTNGSGDRVNDFYITLVIVYL